MRNRVNCLLKGSGLASRGWQICPFPFRVCQEQFWGYLWKKCSHDLCWLLFTLGQKTCIFALLPWVAFTSVSLHARGSLVFMSQYKPSATELVSNGYKRWMHWSVSPSSSYSQWESFTCSIWAPWVPHLEVSDGSSLHIAKSLPPRKSLPKLVIPD